MVLGMVMVVVMVAVMVLVVVLVLVLVVVLVSYQGFFSRRSSMWCMGYYWKYGVWGEVVVLLLSCVEPPPPKDAKNHQSRSIEPPFIAPVIYPPAEMVCDARILDDGAKNHHNTLWFINVSYLFYDHFTGDKFTTPFQLISRGFQLVSNLFAGCRENLVTLEIYGKSTTLSLQLFPTFSQLFTTFSHMFPAVYDFSPSFIWHIRVVLWIHGWIAQNVWALAQNAWALAQAVWAPYPIHPIPSYHILFYRTRLLVAQNAWASAQNVWAPYPINIPFHPIPSHSIEQDD